MSESISTRPFRKTDEDELAKYLNNKKIWDQLRDYLPHPYSTKDARDHIERSINDNPTQNFAIDYKNELVGSISLVLQEDVYRHSAETGFWIAEPFWGKGIATAAIKHIIDYGFNQLGIVRIYASVMQNNIASMKALVKAGFQPEGVFKKGFIKNEEYLDEHRFGILNHKNLNNEGSK